MTKNIRVFSNEEIELLKQNYHNGALFCQTIINKTAKQIRNKSAKLKLRVSEEKIKEYYHQPKKINPNKVFSVNHEQFINIKTPEAAYILGLIWADGHIPKDRNTITLASTFPDAEHFIKIFKKTGNWSVFSGKQYKPTWKKQCHIYATNPFLSKYLKENDYITKSWMSADKILEKIPKEFERFWLMGLLDGDGHISFYKDGKYAVSFSSGIEQDWYFLSKIFDRENLEYSINKNTCKSGSSSSISVYGLKKSIKFLSFIYGDGEPEMALRRKYEIFLKMKEKEKEIEGRYHGVCFSKRENKWRAFSKSQNGKQKDLGRFPTKELALEAVNKNK